MYELISIILLEFVTKDSGFVDNTERISKVLSLGEVVPICCF